MRILVLISAFLYIPLLYDLFKGTAALKEALTDDRKGLDLFILSLLSAVFCLATALGSLPHTPSAALK